MSAPTHENVVITELPSFGHRGIGSLCDCNIQQILLRETRVLIRSYRDSSFNSMAEAQHHARRLGHFTASPHPELQCSPRAKESGQPVALKTPHIDNKRGFAQSKNPALPIRTFRSSSPRPTTLLCQQSVKSCRAHPLSVKEFTLDTVPDIGKLRPAPPVCGPFQI